jgi:hypothetical protein
VEQITHTGEYETVGLGPVMPGSLTSLTDEPQDASEHQTVALGPLMARFLAPLTAKARECDTEQTVVLGPRMVEFLAPLTRHVPGTGAHFAVQVEAAYASVAHLEATPSPAPDRRRAWAAVLGMTALTGLLEVLVNIPAGVIAEVVDPVGRLGLATPLWMITVLVVSYAFWITWLGRSCAENWRLLRERDVSSSALSLGAYRLARQRVPGRRGMQAIAAAAGYLVLDAVGEIPYWLGAGISFAATSSAALSVDLLAGANVTAALIEIVKTRLSRSYRARRG